MSEKINPRPKLRAQEVVDRGFVSLPDGRELDIQRFLEIIEVNPDIVSESGGRPIVGLYTEIDPPEDIA